ncbi:MAG: helix-turn-helix domain-containing protein, partial [Chloroflexaceae bacterium]|nr:helix-turn-helix domain-containing protein [Chloroflexaceae bacterium]
LLAKALHVPLKKLYYHVNLLEEHGLIRVSSTRVVSGIIEKQYQVTAYRISVSRKLLANDGTDGDAAEGVEALLSFLLGHTESEIRKSFQAGLINPASTKLSQDGIVLGRNWLRLTPQQAQELSDQMFDVLLAFARQQAPADDSNSRYYEVLQGFYPVVAPPAATSEHDLSHDAP